MHKFPIKNDSFPSKTRDSPLVIQPCMRQNDVRDHYVLAGVKRRYALDRFNLTSPINAIDRRNKPKYRKNGITKETRQTQMVKQKAWAFQQVTCSSTRLLNIILLNQVILQNTSLREFKKKRKPKGLNNTSLLHCMEVSICTINADNVTSKESQETPFNHNVKTD